jgi:DNA-binding PadR family transcriptional regulator
MHAKISRELTTLEYILLGVLSMGPQSGYSINSTLQNGIYRWKASPGATYPALKRLEQNDMVSSEIEAVTETQSRKVFRLTPQGEALIDHWIMAPLTESELLEEHNIMLVKFLFAEARFPGAQVLAFLDEYEKRMDIFDAKLRVMYQFAKAVSTPHQKLIYRSIAMERFAHRRWIRMARLALRGAEQDESKVLEAEDPFAAVVEALFSA